MSWSCPIVSWRECTPKGDLSKSLINVVFVRRSHLKRPPSIVLVFPPVSGSTLTTFNALHQPGPGVIMSAPLSSLSSNTNLYAVLSSYGMMFNLFETKIKFPVLLTRCRLETLTVNVNWFVNRQKPKQTAFLRLRRREVKGERGKFLFLFPDFLFEDSGVVVLLSVSFLSIGFHSLPNKPWCKEI